MSVVRSWLDVQAWMMAACMQVMKPAGPSQGICITVLDTHIAGYIQGLMGPTGQL